MYGADKSVLNMSTHVFGRSLLYPPRGPLCPVVQYLQQSRQEWKLSYFIFYLIAEEGSFRDKYCLETVDDIELRDISHNFIVERREMVSIIFQAA